MDYTAESKSTSTVRYQDCILGKVGVPKERTNKALFQIVGIGISIPFTATVNWMIHATSFTWAEFSQVLFLYPLTFAIALFVRFLVANPLSDKVVRDYISPRVEGLKKTISVAFLNIIIMGTVIGLIKSALLFSSGDTSSWDEYLSSLPLSYLISFIFSYFITSPLLKKAFMKQTNEGVECRHLKDVKTGTHRLRLPGKTTRIYNS